MVAYLLKPEGSEDFHQIVDFLNTSHIKYALTENPTIYVSLIQQFWQTASASTSENGEMEITATIDGRVKTITEASIRRHLKLEDSDGISTLPNTKIFEQLALMGFIQIFLNKHKRLLLPHNRTYIAPTLTHKLFSNMRRASKGYTGVDIPLFPTMLVQGPNLQGQGSTVQSDSHHTTTSAPSTSQPPTSPPSMQTTHVAEEAATLPHDSPLPRVHSLGSDEGSMTLHELTVLCTTLSKKVESLESDLKQTKLTYGAAFTKLIMKVKRLEKEVKLNKARRRAKIVVSDDEDAEKDTSKQGRSMIEDIDQDAGVSLVQIDAEDQGRFEDETDTQVSAHGEAHSQGSQPEDQLGVFSAAKILADVARVHTYSKRRMTVSTGSGGISTAKESVSTAGALMPVSTAGMDQGSIPSPSVSKDKGEKYSEQDLPMKLVELVNQRKKFFSQQRAEAKRNKPMTPAQQKAYMSTYIKNQEGGYSIKQLKSLSFEQVKEIFEATMRRVQSFMPMDSELEIEEASGSGEEQSAKKENELSEEEIQKLMMIVPVEEVYVKALQVKYQIIDWEVYIEDSRKYWKIIRVERFSSTDPIDDKERILWVELKRLFELDIDDILWKLQRYMHDPLTWRLYDTCGVYHVSTNRGHDIFMSVEKDYPLTRGIMIMMLANKLQVDQSLEMANKLLRKIFIQAERPRQ
ncbi:hypothetical protein Tco_0072655 [Tanacetum coccineum]